MPISESSTADLDVNLRSSWADGVVVDFSLIAEQSLNGWTIEFEYAGDIVNIWNARIVSRDGNRYIVESMGYNSVLAAGASTGFGFQGSGSATDVAPISINGDTFDSDDDPLPEPVPTVSVSDATASEEDGSITFTLSLSAISDEDVVVDFETLEASAQAGSDFVPLQAQVVIPAGQMSATVTLQLVNDDSPEGTEQFDLRLVSAIGAEVADAIGAGQITDTDLDPTPPEPPANPVVTISDASLFEGDPGMGGGPATDGTLISDGPLSTSGNQIVDANGNAVQIRAVNWFGAENDVRAPHGLWQRPMTDMMDQMVAEGFNAIRLPFSVQNILEDQVATSVAGDPSLAGLTTLQIFDRIIEYAEDIGIKIILDAHRITRGNGAEGIWYSGSYDEADWVSAWELLAQRYGDSPAVIGADLLNEPHLGTWGTGSRNDWAAAAEQAGNAVLDVAPDWLILVEGIGNYNGDGYWWGGQLQGVRDRPVVLQADDKLVYSPHDYPASIFQQSWFTDGSNLYDVFRENWGFIYEEGIAPILLGEFGSRLENPLDLPWADAITAYLGGDFNGDGVNDLPAGAMGPSFAWWSWNPNSGDTGGYVLDDWVTVRQNAADLLDPLLDSDAGGDPVDGPVHVTFDVMLDAPAAADVTYAYETRDGTARAGEDYVASAGTVSFAAGQQAAQIQIEVMPDTDVEDDETFSLVLSDLDGSELLATGTIIDDDQAMDPDPVDPDPVDPDPVDPDPVDPPTNPTGTYEISLDDWGSGFVARFNITPGEAVDGGWTATIATTATITNIWNAEVVSHENGILAIRNVSWNASIGADETIEVGIQGSGSASGLDLVSTSLPLAGVAEPGDDPVDPPVDPVPVDPPVDPDPVDPGTGGGSGPFVGGGQTYVVGQTLVVTGFDPARDMLDLGPNSIHNQIPVDTADGFMMLHMFNPGLSMLVEGVNLADLHPESFAPILDSHLQQDLSAALAYEDGSGLVRPNTVYVRSHEEGVEEIVDFNPTTDKVSFFYLSVRGDGQLNFAVEDTAQGARFYSPLTGQSLTLRDVSFADLDSSHFEWRANQLEDGIAGRMGLASVIDGFTYPNENIFSGKSVAMAGGVDRAPYHSQPDYTGTPIGGGTAPVDPVDPGDGGTGSVPIVVTVTGGSVTESDPGMVHVHDDGTDHVHDDGHRYITFTVALDAPAAEELTLTYATADGTAIADTTSDVAWDYHETTGTLIFTPGEQTKTVVVSVHPDTLVETTETFTLSVSGDNITGTLQATGTILDNDVEDPDTPEPVDPDPDPDPVDPHPHPMPSDFTDITEYGVHHGTSSHTGHDELMGGRTAITTEAVIAYNGLRNFLGLEDVTIEDVGTWAFDNTLTNNTQAWGGDLQGVGLWYAMQGAKVGWIRDDAFDPQILADIQREARLGDPANVMSMVEQYGHDGFADFLVQHGLDGHFIETLKMEPHYGGWMHGRTHGWLNMPEGAIAHDVNHLTVLSHDQTQPFMNDTFDWPQWPALNVPHQDVIDYFQSMVVLGDPLGDALPSSGTPSDPVVLDPVDPDPVVPDPVDPNPTTPSGDGSDSLDAQLTIANDWGSGAVINLEITNVDQFDFTGGWTVAFDFDPSWITGSWNSDWTATGDGLAVSDVGWNGSIGAGQTIIVGFQVSTGSLDEDLLNTEAEFAFV